jgi:hypothetical protein
MQMPERVVYRSTAELVPYAHNARTHSADQVAQIAASMQGSGSPPVAPFRSRRAEQVGRSVAAALGDAVSPPQHAL